MIQTCNHLIWFSVALACVRFCLELGRPLWRLPGDGRAAEGALDQCECFKQFVQPHYGLMTCVCQTSCSGMRKWAPLSSYQNRQGCGWSSIALGFFLPATSTLNICMRLAFLLHQSLPEKCWDLNLSLACMKIVSHTSEQSGVALCPSMIHDACILTFQETCAPLSYAIEGHKGRVTMHLIPTRRCGNPISLLMYYHNTWPKQKNEALSTQWKLV